MTEITQEGWKNKALSMLLAQLTSYVLLIAATVIPSPGTVPIIPLIIAALTLAAFVVFWPFRGSMLDRIVTLVFGAISLIFVIVPFPTSEVPPDQTAADGSVLPWYSWALAMGLLLVVLGRGASEISSTFGLNQSFSDILTGIILFFIIGSEFFITYRVSLRKGGKKEA